LITMTETLRLLKWVNSGVNYGKKGFYIDPCGQFHKTFFGITYAPIDITSVETDGNTLKAVKIMVKKVLLNCSL
jgi:hypothetical protein